MQHCFSNGFILAWFILFGIIPSSSYTCFTHGSVLPHYSNVNANHPLRRNCDWHHHLHHAMVLSYHPLDHTAIPLDEFIETIWLAVHCKWLWCRMIFYAQKTLNSIIPSGPDIGKFYSYHTSQNNEEYNITIISNILSWIRTLDRREVATWLHFILFYFV